MHGINLNHEGPLQDGAGKSMTGGSLSVKGNCCNVLGYGASGGKIFVCGSAGTRAGVLMKGATMVVEGVGNFACEYMTSGSF